MANDRHEGRAEAPNCTEVRGAGTGVAARLGPQFLRFRAVIPVIRAAGLVPWAAVFAILFAIATCTVAALEPGVGGIGDAAWLMFQVITTIGLGDYTCVTLPGRVAAVVLSVYSVFFLALITGAVVSYCQERMAARRDESVAHFIDQLEHLPELSHDELVELSEKVKRIEGRWRKDPWGR